MEEIKRTTPLQNSIIIASMIGSLLAMYDDSNSAERRKSILILKARIKKFLYSRNRSNRKDFLIAIAIADDVWQQTIHHFCNSKIRIDIMAIIIKLHNLYEKQLSKYANVHQKQMDAFERSQEMIDNLEIELHSYELADYIFDTLSDITGIKRVILEFQKEIVYAR